MIECLIDWIFFSPLYPADTPEVSKSKYYVTDLPGISLLMIQKIASKDEDAFEEVWQNSKKLAHLRLANDFYMKLAEIRDIKMNNVIWQTGQVSKANAESSFSQSATFLRFGKSISAYEVSSITVYANEPATGVIFKALDALKSTELKSVTVDLTEGWNVVPFELQTNVPNLQFTYEGVGLMNSLKSEDYTFQDCDCIQEDEFSQIPSSDGEHYLWPQLTVTCSVDPIICENKKMLTEAYQNLLGFYLMERKVQANLGNDRMNFFTTGNIELTEITRDRYLNRYNEILDKIVLVVKLDPDICFGCGTASSIRTVMVGT